MRLWNYIIHVAGRVFAKGVSTPSARLGIFGHVRFVIPIKVAKQMKSVLRI